MSETVGSLAHARLIVGALIAGGVREVVLAPGSRSAPLAYALLAADDQRLLRLHVRVDERSAGFLALGLAKASDAPAAVVTTSGTAAANLHPAVLEAAHSNIALVAVTADRPRGLVGTGANQTTDQFRLFGAATRGFAQLDDRDPPEQTRFHVARLVAAATGVRTRLPGPVQLNVSLRGPLAPDHPLPPLELPAPAVLAAARGAKPETLAGGPATVVIAGDGSPRTGRAVAELAAAAEVPLLAEPSSNARRGGATISTYRILLGSGLGAEIERVVVTGRPTLSRPVSRLLGRRDVEVVVVGEHAEWVDPGLTASRVVDAIRLEPVDPGWLSRWRAADAVVSDRLAALLAETAPSRSRGGGVSGPALAAELWRSVPAGSPLVVGSSNPIRDLDLAPLRTEPPLVFANRGLAGIDGTVSTAAGIALSLGPTTALLGDLTFLHDLGGLAIPRDSPRPALRIVVADDGGGSIFATLEHGAPELAGSYERLFGTAVDADLAALVGGLGWRYRRAGTLAEVGALSRSAPTEPEVVHVEVDRTGRRDLAQLITALAATL